MIKLLFKPTEFFKNLKQKPVLGQAVGYLFIGALISAIFTVIMDTVFNVLFSALVEDMPELTLLGVLSTFFVTLLVPIVGTFVYGLFMRLSVKFFSIKAKYSDLVALDAYATAPVLLYQWIPVIGFFASSIHYIFLIVISGKQLLKLDSGKAFLSLFLVPFIMAMLVAGIVFIGIMAVFIGIGVVGGIPGY